LSVKILAFDLSTRQGSIALIGRIGTRSHETISKREWPNDRRNSALFFRALNEIIRAHGAPDRIVVGVGPGSYTGTRIAISAAIGLELTCGGQVRGLPSISAMSDESDFAVIGDAKRASFFFGRIAQYKIMGEIELLSQEGMSRRICELAVPMYTSDDLPQFPRAQVRYPRAELLCSLALGDENLAHIPIEPIYLRPPHITSPQKK
jgi:tRNA threonylcarbamoyladenosine biosynthesis protein TsaB